MVGDVAYALDGLVQLGTVVPVVESVAERLDAVVGVQAAPDRRAGRARGSRHTRATVDPARAAQIDRLQLPGKARPPATQRQSFPDLVGSSVTISPRLSFTLSHLAPPSQHDASGSSTGLLFCVP